MDMAMCGRGAVYTVLSRDNGYGLPDMVYKGA